MSNNNVKKDSDTTTTKVVVDDCCPRPHPEVMYHGKIQELFPNTVYFVQGTVKLGGSASPIPMTFGRNMTILRDNVSKGDHHELILFNTVRLDEETLTELDKLGTVTHIVKLACFHGMDDPFYKERYPNAIVWAPKNTNYFPNFDVDATPYFIPDQYYDNNTIFPFFKNNKNDSSGQKEVKAKGIVSPDVSANFLAVDPDLAAIIDRLEVQLQLLAFLGSRGECAVIPKRFIRPEQPLNAR